MTHLQLKGQLQGHLTTSSSPTSHYDQRMVKDGDYRRASRQGREGNYVLELIPPTLTQQRGWKVKRVLIKTLLEAGSHCICDLELLKWL